VPLLTIGAFARASRLSPKALRLYDELGLLRPAEVDPASGYRLQSGPGIGISPDPAAGALAPGSMVRAGTWPTVREAEMHPDITRAVAAARVQDLLVAAEQSDLARQARRAPRHAKPSRARPWPLRRLGRRARPVPAARAAGPATVSNAARREPADGSGHAGRRAA